MASQRHPANPFWDFIQSLDPNQHPGPGVDRSAAPPPDFFASGFPFHPRFGGPARHGPPGPWDDWQQWFQPAGPDHGRHGRHRNHHENQANPVNENQPQEAPATPAAPTAAAAAEKTGNDEREQSPDTMDIPDPAEVTPEESEDDFPSCGRGPSRGRGRGRGFGHGHGHGHEHGHGPGHRGHGRGGRGGFRRGFPFGPQPPPPPPPHHHHHHDGGRPPFDFAGLMRGLAEQFGGYTNGAHSQDAQRSAHRDEGDAFEPPVDVFNTDRAYVLHVALPGARKEDVGVSWDPDAGALRIAGVVHRPGDEAFLQSLASTERRVGVFERSIALPPPGAATAKDEVDGFGITAKMEDGLLVVTVPKVEKEWTEIRKVDIE
ncbi:Heat shock protein 16 [Paramyrothecium foliicola]|nr:Heat shock protein 16 [Paramyrothecium foliicola]